MLRDFVLKMFLVKNKLALHGKSLDYKDCLIFDRQVSVFMEKEEF